MALGSVPGLELSLEGLGVPGMGTPLGGLAHLGSVQGSDEERKRKMVQVIDILQV